MDWYIAKPGTSSKVVAKGSDTMSAATPATRDMWDVVHTERRALALDLHGLTDAQWETPSMCLGWTVRDVLAHMTATARVGQAQFIGKFIVAGFNFKTMQSKGIARRAGQRLV